MTMRLMVIAVLALVYGCCPKAAPKLSFDSPFGLWSTERGQTVEVKRDGSYNYCDQGLCQGGKATRDGYTLVKLDGFFDMKVTERLRKMSGLDEMQRLDRELDKGLSLPHTEEIVEIGDGGMDDEYRFHLCQGRPCIIVGRHDYDVMRFVKLKDY